MTRKIAIIGGGVVGATLAKALQDKAEVTLIEQRSHFIHAPAMIRAVVQPALLDRALIPYDKLLTKGRVVQARAQGVDATGVTLDSGDHVAADFVVVATGSDNAMPFKAKGADIAGLRADNARIHDMLGAAQSVAIVGAGAVGTELAGEIAHFMPGKTITLISADDRLFPQMPEGFGAALALKLRAAGVEVITGVRADNLQSLTEPFAGTLELSDGRKIEADLIFPVTGSRAVSGLLETLPGARKTTANRIAVDGWMRPSSLANVFAAGDVADCGDAMTIVAASRQGPWLKKTLTALIDGKDIADLPRYAPWTKAPFLVPLGPHKGHSFLIRFSAGNFLTRAMKGKDLFVSKYHKLFGLA